MFTNKLILGDNLEILKTFDDNSIDLIYLDPPFFSNRNYEVIWGDEGEVRSFQDRWAGGIEHYLAWLKERVLQMHRILKPTGSIFLHCDWHADAYIRCEILDSVFGTKNMVNHLIWCYSIGGKSKRTFGKKHDSIFFYSKSNKYTFNEKGAIIARKQNTHMKKSVDKEGRIYQEKIVKKTGKRYIYYEDEGKIAEDYWTDIETLNREDKERIGYPTQKPETLLERIIKCASKEGDIVLDPFVGGGTTVVVADKLNRKWIGIDQSVAAIRVSDLRLRNQHSLYSKPYELLLRKYDYDSLRNKDAFEFEIWIIQKFGGTPHSQKGADKGIDGHDPNGAPIQVKRSDNVGVNVVKNFSVSAKQYDKTLFENNVKQKKAVGFIIAFSFSRGAIEEVARLKNKEKIVIELIKVGDIVPYGKKPIVKLTANELENNKYALNATAKSETEVEFYSWDFDHKPEVGFKADI
ncbi:MAG: hypothetical protein FWH18_09215, partial [Marinilabiliaceae bacterium]|nr:hypothetical protein [Marinilabiliaceae bacterium]